MYPSNPVESIRKFHPELTTLRRDLHAHPELGFQELRTSGIVAGALEALGIEVHRGIGKTGVVGVVHGRERTSGRMVGLRADMDALTSPRRALCAALLNQAGTHACLRPRWSYCDTARRCQVPRADPSFQWHSNTDLQPAEEGLGGAKAMLDDGLF